ncbi:MAG: glycoside hydrolase family 127 protein [Tannerella sp.]|jgi:hypothetical protein|nr:glycoside hydrolase family 127 protein [Tannerella sp.]
MKKILYLLPLIMLFSCNKIPEIEQRDKVFLQKRNFIVNDLNIKVKPRFIPLPAGDIRPAGWVRDWAEAAANGITGHLDEWNPVYGMGWKGVGFEAVGADPKTGTGWPLEQCSYWLDGAVRLAYILNDSALINKVNSRLDLVIDGILENDSKSFVWWTDIDFKNSNFNNWAHSHFGRVLVAYYEATGNPRILEALTKVYSRFEPQPITHHFGDLVSGCCNIDPMMRVYELTGNRDVLNTILKIAADSLTQDAVGKWNNGSFDSAHGVITYENLRIPAIMYLVTNQQNMLAGSLEYLRWLDHNHLLPYDIISSEEHVAGIGSTRNTETCNVACSEWTYQQMFEITGAGSWGDRIEKVFFNAAPAPVARDFQTMSYYQSPNHIEGLLPEDVPGHPGKGAYNFKPTGHTVLCCVGNLNRAIPFFIMHQWLGTTDKGLAAALYAPSVLHTVVNEGIPVEIQTETNYPFEETIRMSVNPSKKVKFPLYLRIPSWCDAPEVTVNGKSINIANTDGFVKIERQWAKNDRIEIHFPMHVMISEGVETPYPRMDYFVKGSAAGRRLATTTDVNSPFRTVAYGPLLFALPVKDLDANTQDPSAKWKYALVTKNAQDVQIEHTSMPAHWSWQITDAPVHLKVKAVEFDWQPTEILPLPKEPVKGMSETELTLIPYGCTKFRISMFPIAAN